MKIKNQDDLDRAIERLNELYTKPEEWLERITLAKEIQRYIMEDQPDKHYCEHGTKPYHDNMEIITKEDQDED